MNIYYLKTLLLTPGTGLSPQSEITQVTAENCDIVGEGRIYQFYNNVRNDDNTWSDMLIACYPTNCTIITRIRKAKEEE